MLFKVAINSNIGKLQQRFWEIDFLRGVAMVMMVIFHSLYFLNYFTGYNFSLTLGFWHIFQTIIATIFLFLVGVSLTINYSRAERIYSTKRLFLKYLKRGLIIFSLGLFITLMTRIFLGENFVRFGILHLIGVSIVLAYPFLKKLHFWNLWIGIVFVALGIYLKSITFDFSWLFWLLFIKTHYYHTVDYFPLLPWFGIVLIGLFFGRVFYPNYIRRFTLADISNFPIIKSFCFLGRHSLVIYFLHQPILIGILYFWSRMQFS